MFATKKLFVDLKNAQQLFDKKFRQLKRQYQNKSCHDLAALADQASNDPNEI